MFAVDGFQREHFTAVIGVDLSLTGPGLAVVHEPWSDRDRARAFSTTLSRVPQAEEKRGLILGESAGEIVRMAGTMVGDPLETLVVMEAILLRSATGKAPERAAFWWRVREQFERFGYPVVSLNPSTRKSLALDDEGRAALKAMTAAERKKRAKGVGLASMRRRWPGVVFADDNAADALVCAETGARALGWGSSLPEQSHKNLSSAVRSLGINERKAQ